MGGASASCAIRSCLSYQRRQTDLARRSQEHGRRVACEHTGIGLAQLAFFGSIEFTLSYYVTPDTLLINVKTCRRFVVP